MSRTVEGDTVAAPARSGAATAPRRGGPLAVRVAVRIATAVARRALMLAVLLAVVFVAVEALPGDAATATSERGD
ncbi:ABC transporter permease, partial [Streptomyces sp. NPDC127044]